MMLLMFPIEEGSLPDSILSSSLKSSRRSNLPSS
jgi:hypothetical protein